MEAIFITLMMIDVVVLILGLSRLTFLKKTIHYGWIDKTKKITLFDYAGNFDGDWITRTIDYKTLLTNNPSDKVLKESIREVKLLQNISIVSLSLLAVGIILGAILSH